MNFLEALVEMNECQERQKREKPPLERTEQWVIQLKGGLAYTFYRSDAGSGWCVFDPVQMVSGSVFGLFAPDVFLSQWRVLSLHELCNEYRDRKQFS